MKHFRNFSLILLLLLPLYTQAAPLNKFGTMQQQQLLPEVSQPQQPTIIIRPQHKQPPPNRMSKKKKSAAVMFKVKRLLNKLPIEKVRAWQKKFERKRDVAESLAKKSIVHYYEQLIALCKKNLAQRSNEP